MCVPPCITEVAMTRQEKDTLRRQIKDYRKNLDPLKKALWDKNILTVLCSLDYYLQCDTVFCYLSMPQEVDTRAFVQRAWADGKKVAAPRSRSGGQMDFYRFDRFSDLCQGPFGILEPKAQPENLAMPQGKRSLLLIPGLAFGKDGSRLGFGGGYYDRYIEKHKGIKIGLVYQECFYDTVPAERHDQTMDFVVTENGIYSISAGGQDEPAR